MQNGERSACVIRSRCEKFLLILVACILGGVLIAVPYFRPGTVDFPPLILAGGEYYKGVGARAERPEDSVKVGTITQVVPDGERPEQEWEANEEALLGKTVYAKGETLYLHGDGVWLLYEKLPEGAGAET